ncbi:MAG: peptidyl-prolyl cis-trans isomerase [Verrucomicrobiales bacterium]|jgi:peptidyl-prolyl cis-trans isomerase B (cyclophilin B)|nr:peptidyl-prolyl cis-trans isomerase [Verrucomicrobiales bacterium]
MAHTPDIIELNMKTVVLTCLLTLALGVSIGCTQSIKIEDKTPKAEKPKEEKSDAKETKSVNTNEVAVIKTAYGEMVVEFWPDVAPKTVENFKKLAKSGFYDGTAFHRIVKGFMIQGGDPLTKDASKEAMWGTGDPGYKINAEFNTKAHQRGVLSMARSNDPNSAGSQFFVCLGDASFLDNKYTAFGKVIKGDDVLGKIGDVETTMSRGGEKSKPVQRQGVESIKIVPADQVK